MPTNHRRPPFVFGHVYQAAKVVSINGVPMTPGDKLTAEQIVDVGEARLRKIYDAGLIDYASDDLPAHYQLPGALEIGKVASVPEVEPIVTRLGEGADASNDDDADEAANKADDDLIAANMAAAALAGAGAPQEPPQGQTPPEQPAAAVEPVPAKVSGSHTPVHKGFGKWYITDEAGNTVSGPHTKRAAEALIDAAKVAGE